VKVKLRPKGGGNLNCNLIKKGGKSLSGGGVPGEVFKSNLLISKFDKGISALSHLFSGKESRGSPSFRE